MAKATITIELTKEYLLQLAVTLGLLRKEHVVESVMRSLGVTRFSDIPEDKYEYVFARFNTEGGVF